MDATRPRRLRDPIRQRWYARWRCIRFARHCGFALAASSAKKPPGTPCLSA